MFREWETIFTSCSSERDVYRIEKELKKNKESRKKNGPIRMDLKREFSKEKQLKQGLIKTSKVSHSLHTVDLCVNYHLLQEEASLMH